MIKFGRDSNIIKGVSGSRKKKDVNQLSITSLLDVMTILLIFMIKNVSMDAAQRNAPNGMLLPSTISNDELIKKGNVIYVRMYTDKILYGTDNIEVGTLQEFSEDRRVKETLLRKLENEVKLHGQQYFAGPKMPNELTQGKRYLEETRYKQIQQKQNEALKEKKKEKESKPARKRQRRGNNS